MKKKMKKKSYLFLWMLLCMMLYTVPLHAQGVISDTEVDSGASIQFSGGDGVTVTPSPEPTEESIVKPKLPQTGQQAGFTFPVTGGVILCMVGCWFYQKVCKENLHK